MDDNKKKTSKANKTLLVWAVILAIIIALQFFSASNDATKFSIQQLMNAASNDSLASISLKYNEDAGKDWYTVKGTIHNPRFNQPDAPKDTPREVPFFFEGQITPENYKTLTDRTSPWKISEESSYSFLKSGLVNTLFFLLVG